MSFIFNCMWIWAQAMLGICFISIWIAIIVGIVGLIAKLFDKTLGSK